MSMKPLLIIIAIMAAVIGGESLWIKSLYADKAQLKIERDAAKATADQCEKDKTITSETSNEYQNRLNSVARQLNDLKRVRANPRCIPITR